MSRLLFAAPMMALVLATVPALAQEPNPQDFDCDVVSGEVVFDTISDTSISGSLSGDLEGTFAWTVDEFEPISVGVLAINRYSFSGSFDTATGSLAGSGGLLEIEIGMLSLTLGSVELGDGTGDLEGTIAGISIFGGNFGPFMSPEYRGVVCDEPALPAPPK